VAYQITFQLGKPSEQRSTEILVVRVGAVSFITAASRKEISWQWWQDNTGFVAGSLYNRHCAFHNFFEGIRGGYNHFSS
jgi:hypothetical protein